MDRNANSELWRTSGGSPITIITISPCRSLDIISECAASSRPDSTICRRRQGRESERASGHYIWCAGQLPVDYPLKRGDKGVDNGQNYLCVQVGQGLKEQAVCQQLSDRRQLELAGCVSKPDAGNAAAAEQRPTVDRMTVMAISETGHKSAVNTL